MRKLDVFDTIIFDLDGTLLNTLGDLQGSTNYALAQMGFPARTMKEVQYFVGNGIAKLIGRAVPKGTGEESVKQCLALFQEHYNLHMADKTEPYPEILCLLTALKERSIKTAVVSNKYDAGVKYLCQTYFGGRIDLAMGDQEGQRKKPAPDCVLAVMEQLKSQREHTLYVGDSDVDMETAKNAGVRAVGVTWGFREEALLRASGADIIVQAPSDIMKLVSLPGKMWEEEASPEESQ